MSGARAVASPTITFGLVSIPCKAYITSKAESIGFNMLTPDKNRVKMQFVDAITGKVVEKKDCTSGYEYEKDKYIELTDEDLDAISADKNNYIEILEVSSDVRLSPDHVEKAYHLAPDNSDKSYRLLIRCLQEKKSVAVGKFYTRGKDHLVALCPVGDVLMMFQLFYKPEIREFNVSFARNTEPTEKEVALGKMLLEQLTSSHFNLEKYQDEYLEKVRVAIAKKQNGEKLEPVKEQVKNAAFDLAALLEQSLKKG